MDDLREPLERYSEGFEWEPGAMHRMFHRAHRAKRRRRLASAAVAIVIGVLGVGAAIRAFGDTTGTVNGSPAASVPVANAIPEGVYWTQPVTRADVMRLLMRAGFSRRDAVEFFFSRALPFDPVIREGLIVQDGFWVQTAKNASGEQEAGWSGNFEVLGAHRLAATGYGCTITYRYSLHGDRLSLRVLNEIGDAPDCGPGDIIAQTAIFNPAPFVHEADDSRSG